MALDRKYEYMHAQILRDGRPVYVRIGEFLMLPDHSFVLFLMLAMSFHFYPPFALSSDVIFIFGLLYYWWLMTRDRTLPFKLPLGAKHKDKKSKDGKPSGIMYLGNTHPYREEVWFNNSDARTHLLYLGTTGSGKTVGLRGMGTNALTWASGFVYIDGKADTDLWSSISAMVRRFGRDDDLLVLNYMTGNSDTKAPSNSMNPFSSGSASYLTQMMVSLMPEAEGDNAMWKERAVSLLGALMPALTYKRDKQDYPMSVGTIRQNLTLGSIVKLSRDESLPEKIRLSLKGYLETLPGYVDAAFDDEGRDKPMSPDQPMIDTTTAKTQHGYLSMQFTRSLQSLADDYGYIFDSQAADVDMVDVVLNRRVMIVLIPALEKSADETANLGKIVAATLKGMMGSTLGSTVEGTSATVIENKPTHSQTPFITIFDEVGYYAAQGMAVMAAQARSLGFAMLFAAQDLPALEKRIKEEARSIAANCNIKIFGKLEDPTQTKEFFEKTVGTSFVTEVSGFAMEAGSISKAYHDNLQAGVQNRGRGNYDAVRAQKEGEAHVAFSDKVMDVKMFFSDPGFAKAMRVTKYLPLSPPDDILIKHVSSITKLRDAMVKKDWTAQKADVAPPPSADLLALNNGFLESLNMGGRGVDAGIHALVSLHAQYNPIDLNAVEIIPEPTPEPAYNNETDYAEPVQANGNDDFYAERGYVPLDPQTKDIIEEAAAESRDAIFQTEPVNAIPASIPTETINSNDGYVELDDDTRSILENAARKSRETIFKTETGFKTESDNED